MKVIAPHERPGEANAPGTEEAQPATIGALLDAGRGLAATCAVCLHSAGLDLADLARRLGADHACTEAALRPKLQCSVCLSCEAVLQEIEQERRPGGASASNVLASVDV